MLEVRLVRQPAGVDIADLIFELFSPPLDGDDSQPILHFPELAGRALPRAERQLFLFAEKFVRSRRAVNADVLFPIDGDELGHDLLSHVRRARPARHGDDIALPRRADRQVLRQPQHGHLMRPARRLTSLVIHLFSVLNTEH